MTDALVSVSLIGRKSDDSYSASEYWRVVAPVSPEADQLGVRESTVIRRLRCNYPVGDNHGDLRAFCGADIPSGLSGARDAVRTARLWRKSNGSVHMALQ